MKKALALSLVAALTGLACASIRVVSESKKGGEIVLEGSRESAMGKAREQMSRVCGAPTAYEIVEEGELGFNAEAGPGQNPHEWHVHYECTDGGPQ